MLIDRYRSLTRFLHSQAHDDGSASDLELLERFARTNDESAFAALVCRYGGVVQQVTYANTCVTQAKHLIVVNAYYGSCSGTQGIPQFKNIIVNGVSARGSQSGAYSRIEGYDTDHLAQLFLANVSLDATTQSGDQNAMVALDNSNMTPAGPNVTTGPFTTGGSVPSCAF